MLCSVNRLPRHDNSYHDRGHKHRYHRTPGFAFAFVEVLDAGGVVMFSGVMFCRATQVGCVLQVLRFKAALAGCMYSELKGPSSRCFP